jgi:hypothetical protein
MLVANAWAPSAVMVSGLSLLALALALLLALLALAPSSFFSAVSFTCPPTRLAISVIVNPSLCLFIW